MGKLTVRANGQTLKLAAAKNSAGATVGVYSDAALTQSVTLPSTFSTDTVFYFVDGDVNVTVTQPDGTIIYSNDVSPSYAGTEISPMSTRTQEAASITGVARLWTSPAASTTLTGTLAAWVITSVDCTAGAGARTLPAANSVAAGTAVCAKKSDTSANNLVVSRAGSDLIFGTGSGATSKTQSLAGEAVEYVSDGVSKWTIRSSDTPSGVLATTYLRPAKVSDLPSPFVIAHRGGSNIAPENSMEAFQIASDLGIDAVEGGDCQKLSDGGLGVMHDDTVDRTTSSSGTSVTWSTLAWRALILDTASWFGSSIFGNLKPPLFDDVLANLGGQVVITPEAKSQGSGAALAARIVRAGLQKSCIVQSFYLADLAAAVAAAIPAAYNNSDLSAAALVAAGVTYNIVNTSDAAVTPTYITNMHAAGIKVIGFTADRHHDVAAWIAKGGDGIFTDDPLYVQGYLRGTYPHVRTTDPFSMQTWYHGMLASSSQNNRGVFASTAKFGFQADTTTLFEGCTQGWANPIGAGTVPTSFTISYTVEYTSANAGDATRWASVLLATDDSDFNDSAGTANGYHFLTRKNGGVGIFKVTNGIASLLSQQATGTTISDAATGTYTITISPTSVTLARTDVALSTSANDTTYRGGYMTFGRNGLKCYFSAVTIA